jgi:hypothetical protein
LALPRVPFTLAHLAFVAAIIFEGLGKITILHVEANLQLDQVVTI